jgi:AcrR family transcriptional regulator
MGDTVDKQAKSKNSRKSHQKIATSVKDEALVEKRRQQIFEAALKAFADGGFHKTNLRQITKLADLAYGSVYDYVKTKDDILFLIYDNILGELYHALLEASGCSQDPKEQLRALIKAAMDHTDEYKDAIILLYQESRVMKTSGHLPEVFEKERSYLRLFVDILERGIEEGVFQVSNVRLLENILPLMCSVWALKRWNLKGMTKEEYTDALIEFVLRGLEVKPAAASQLALTANF